MRSDEAPRLKEARALLLPEKGADFQIQYYAGEVPVQYGEEEHTWVNAVSPGLKVVCAGSQFRVSMARQRKPILPEAFNGEDGAYRRALRVAINGDEVGNNADYYIHILGDTIMVTTKKINIAQMVQDQSLTEDDQQILDLMRAAQRDAKRDG